MAQWSGAHTCEGGPGFSSQDPWRLTTDHLRTWGLLPASQTLLCLRCTQTGRQRQTGTHTRQVT